MAGETSWLVDLLQAQYTGYGLAGFFGIIIVLGMFSGFVVPGWLYRRSQRANEALQKSLTAALDQNKQLLEANELTRYVISQIDIKKAAATNPDGVTP